MDPEKCNQQKYKIVIQNKMYTPMQQGGRATLLQSQKSRKYGELSDHMFVSTGSDTLSPWRKPVRIQVPRGARQKDSSNSWLYSRRCWTGTQSQH